MIIAFTDKEGQEQHELVADYVILNPYSDELVLVDQQGDKTTVEYSPNHPVVMLDEGGDNSE